MQRDKNGKINAQIKKERIKWRRQTEKILLLGPESARAEVLNRFRNVCGKPFSEVERRETKVAVLRRAISTMKTLIEHLEGLSIEHEQKPTGSTPTLLYDEEISILRSIERLWNDPLFQARLNASTDCLMLLKVVRLSVCLFK